MCKYLAQTLFIVLILLLIISCQKKEPIKIGFIGGLTGRISDLGIAGRDGVMLAIEQQNKAGGIRGKQIQLVIKDDQQIDKVAQQVFGELIDEKVAAVIGPMTSSVAMAIIPQIRKHQLLTISPTVSTNELSGIDDPFFRVYPCSAQTSNLLAEHAFNKMGMRKVFVVYDVTNRAHTESAYIPFRKTFEKLGGKIVGEWTFLSGPAVHFMEIAKEIISLQPDGLYVLANAMDTSMICQQLSKLNHKIPTICSDWSATDDVIKFGGDAVEGLTFFHTLDRESTSPKYLEFVKDFKNRFGYEASFASAHAYDAAKVLLRVLEENKKPESLKTTLQAIQSFEGLQSTISFNEFGDVVRTHFLFTIHQAKFQKK